MKRRAILSLAILLAIVVSPSLAQDLPNPCLIENATVLQEGPVTIGPVAMAYDIDISCSRRIIDVLFCVDKPYDLPLTGKPQVNTVMLPDGTRSELSASYSDPSGNEIYLDSASYLIGKRKYVVLGRPDWGTNGHAVPERRVVQVRVRASKPIVVERLLLRCYDPWHCEDDHVSRPPN